MRRFPFLDWLDEATDGPVGYTLKTLFAALLLASLLWASYRTVRDYRAELRATNEAQARANRQFLERARKSPAR